MSKLPIEIRELIQKEIKLNALIQGPLQKTKDTILLEAIIKILICNFDKIELKKHEDSFFIKINNNFYNLTKLLKNAD